MTHIKYPNELGPTVPHEPNWRDEAMRMNALLHSAMTGGAEAEERAAKFELERDALLRVVTDNHLVLKRAEDAEAKIINAVEALQDMCAEFRAYDLPYGSKAYLKAAAVLNEIDKQ